MGEAERRAALNEDVFRQVNERIEGLGEQFGVREADFLCECADTECVVRMSVPIRVYEAVRAHPARFLVAPGHVRADVERVLEAHRAYLVVEKQGEAGATAAAMDQRSD
jgi:hypothetical protein